MTDRLFMGGRFRFHLESYLRSITLLGAGSLLSVSCALAQSSGSLGNGLSARAVGRAGNIVAEQATALDAVAGNPAGLAGISAPLLDLTTEGIVAGGSFQNAANADGKLSGLSGVPSGAFAVPLGKTRWVASASFTPEFLMRANWHFEDTPGTAGVTYGYQRQESQIVALRSSLGIARNFGRKWSAGVTLGVVYNQNQLNAPYIFQQQPALQGLKVLLALSTRGYGWNGSAGAQWQTGTHVRTGLAWKSGTSIHTQGGANGSASALFTALGLADDPAFHYHAQVMVHLPQAFDAGLTWQAPRQFNVCLQGDFVAWGQAFQQLPITLTGGTNSTINSVVGAANVKDAVALHWRNQGAFHVGIEQHVSETVAIRMGYAYATNPVPGRTLTPMTAAIMQNTVAAGGGWNRGRWHYDAAYQAQLPSAKTVGISALQAGEFDHSRVEVWTQSVTVSAQVKF